MVESGQFKINIYFLLFAYSEQKKSLRKADQGVLSFTSSRVKTRVGIDTTVLHSKLHTR